MLSVLLGVVAVVAATAALIFRNAFRKAISDQMDLANLTMEALTSKQAHSQMRNDFLNFILEARCESKEALMAAASTHLIATAQGVAHRTVPANLDIYWAMNKTPEMFFENGDPTKPR